MDKVSVIEEYKMRTVQLQQNFKSQLSDNNDLYGGSDADLND